MGRYVGGDMDAMTGKEATDNEAEQCFPAANTSDGPLAPLQAALAQTSSRRSAPVHFRYRRALGAAQAAFGADATVVEAHYVLACIRLYYDWDWSGACDALACTLKRDPQHAAAHRALADYYAIHGLDAQAQASGQRALAIEPLSPGANADIGWHFYLARHYDAASHYALRALELEERCYGAQRCLLLTQLARGNACAAVAAMRAIADAVATAAEATAVSSMASGRAEVMAVWRKLQHALEYGTSGEICRAFWQWDLRHKEASMPNAITDAITDPMTDQRPASARLAPAALARSGIGSEIVAETVAAYLRLGRPNEALQTLERCVAGRGARICHFSAENRYSTPCARILAFKPWLQRSAFHRLPHGSDVFVKCQLAANGVFVLSVLAVNESCESRLLYRVDDEARSASRDCGIIGRRCGLSLGTLANSLVEFIAIGIIGTALPLPRNPFDRAQYGIEGA